ncbi:MAG: hypothetical protein GWN18_04555 [Thermoplasmata archaeon]|nr:hypothetical protein [Thermoplasmata archaeon]NIS11297.1 hypothetical protein [Thermoplasmata archaeon]NIS19751.1 hypothetical protein [Thermoplasmata archaeon]NIT76310.1 hypothetical protein [Thermoplasmata archaeon]NIU48862.1 hypothetical protein [Thermoplasmata archaeon]
MIFAGRKMTWVLRFAIVAAAGLTALLIVAGPSMAASNEGPPVILEISEGGYASEWYDLEVSVEGDMARGTAFWAMDDDYPDRMEEMEDTGASFYVHILLDDVEDGPHTLWVVVYNSTGTTVTDSVVIDVDNHSPYVEAITNHSTIHGDFVFEGRAVDPYLNESAVYCLIDGDETSSKANVMTKVGDHFEFTVDATTMTDGEHLARIWAFDLWGNSNKSHAIVLFVSNKANLVITNVDWTKTKVEAGKDVVAVVTVKNEGGTTASDFKVSILEGDKAVGSSKVTDPLGPGESRDVTVKWSMDEEDSREMYIAVDTGEDVEESKEDDNQWPEPQTVTFEGGSPGFGMVLAIFAVALVALLASGRRRR